MSSSDSGVVHPAQRAGRVALAELPSLSPFIERSLRIEAGEDAARRDELLQLWWRTRWDRAQMQAALGEQQGDAGHFASALRRLRRRVIASLAVRDATGACGLEEVVATTTALAELAIERALALHARELVAVHGTPASSDGTPQDLLVVGMGKLGGAELNVSSDIDLVFVYDEDGDTQGAGSALRTLTNHEFFARLGRRVIAALADVTADGFVFRVDMRLRPNGNAGPLALSTAMLEEYLTVQGREWERFAWLKGRVVSAPVIAPAAAFSAQASALAQVVHPFVYRKYLDFGAINALRDLHARIRAESARRDLRRDAGADHVKLGRGGIREIEFIAQTFQIIRGGRDPALRSRATLATLATLGEQGALPVATAERLASAYVFLRNLEHALQYVDDAQTHVLPADAVARDNVARLLGARSEAALLVELREAQDFVAGVFDSVFAEPASSSPRAPMPPAWERATDADEAPLIEHLTQHGYRDPAGTVQRLRSVLASRRMQAASESARAGFERLLQRALAAAAELAQQGGAPAHDIGADEHFARFAQLAEVIVGRNTYVALLNQFPQAFDRVMRVLGASRWAADYVALHPILLDELLDARLHEREPDWAAWSETLRRQLDEADGDQERQMNLLRDAHHAQVFRLLVADLEGRLTVERLADHLSALADRTLDLTLERAWRMLPRRHRATPRFAVIGYGKLGGKELGYASDLDLIFLFDDDHPDAAEIYAMLARRLITWLSTQTSSGILFDIDLRLRPNGNAGLLVSSFEAFVRYQRNEDGLGAWVWEHQALTRARYCAGDPDLGDRFEEERVGVLTQVRDLAHLKREVLAMRARMRAGHPNPTQLFDLKHDHGGMVDIEFIVQTIVLAYAHHHPELVKNLGNIALLKIAGELGLIDSPLAQQVSDAYRTFRRLQHRLRLNGAERARVQPAEVEAETAAVTKLWEAVLGAARAPD